MTENIQRLISVTGGGRMSNFKSVLNELSSFPALNFNSHTVTLFNLVIFRNSCLVLLQTLHYSSLQASNKIFQSHLSINQSTSCTLIKSSKTVSHVFTSKTNKLKPNNVLIPLNKQYQIIGTQ